MNKLKTLLITGLALTLWGCATSTPATSDQVSTGTDKNTAEQAATTTTSDSESATPEIDPSLPAGRRNLPLPADGSPKNSPQPNIFGATLEENDIFCFGEKVGYLKDDRVFMKIDDKTVSFIPPRLESDTSTNPAFDIKKLICSTSDWADENFTYGNFSYLDLDISTKVFSPYSIYTPIVTPEENNQITYKCDGSLVKGNERGTGEPSGDIPYRDCLTNEADLLTQYEFSAASGSPVLVTGGEFVEGWKKIFIKRGEKLNYFFLGGISTNMNDYYTAGEAVGTYRKKTSEESLQRLLDLPENLAKINAWQELVKSFREESAA